MALDKFQPYLFVSAGEQSNKLLTPTYADGIAQFQAQRAQELTGLTIRIDPIQEGTGDPSPDNIRPISGRTGLTVTRAGKNLLDPSGVALSGDKIVFAYRYTGVTLRANTTYTFSYKTTVAQISIADKTGRPNYAVTTNGRSVTYTPTEDMEVCFRIDFGTSETPSADGWQLEIGSTASAYTPYVDATTYPISWQTEAGTIYGGTLDVVSGVLTVTDAQIASYAGETLPGEWISDRDVYAAGTTPTTGAQVVYKLAPQTYRLTGAEVRTIAGFNQIYSDAGPVIDIKF